jgi:16S rRNA A1518/A1519 N6-dimethyltransferase RsmA/KsgA/DIM1 with predicted DNA glycosylase/AP lyase activity
MGVGGFRQAEVAVAGSCEDSILLRPSFLVDCRWLCRVVELAEPSYHEVFFVIGGGSGELSGLLSQSSKIVTVEPDESIANYLYSLELFRTEVINAEPHMVLGDVPFDKVLCVQPELVNEYMLRSLLRVPFQKAVIVAPDEVLAAFRGRNMLGSLLRASYDLAETKAVPKNAFSPFLEEPCSLVVLAPAARKDPVAASLRLLLREAGTMRGLLTRSCREYFSYTLAEAQDATKKLSLDLLRKRFWDVSEEEFRKVQEWLKKR